MAASGRTVAMKAPLVSLGVVLVGAGACWWLWIKHAPPETLAATVDVSRDYSTCTVILPGSDTGHDVSCSNVGAYLRDVAKLNPGAGILVRPRDKHGHDASEAMTHQIHAAGFLLDPYAGGMSPEVSRGDR